MEESIKPEVTVSCITYNHKPIIRKCLEGFVMQKTTFPFKVVIHDDCSTDGTTEIIREYENKYPELFEVIYEEENQYQQGNSVSKIIKPYLTGKYIASCEGDDYWTDPEKLQKQYDYMEAHPEVTLCVTAAIEYNLETNVKYRRPSIVQSGTYKIEDVLLQGGAYFPTCSFFVRQSVDLIPARWGVGFAGDFNNIIQCALKGDIYYLSDVTSVKTDFLPGSWSSRHRDKELMRKHILNAIESMNRFNEETGKKYDKQAQQKIAEYNYRINCELDGNYKLLFNDPYYKPILKSFSKVKKIRCFLMAYLKPVYRATKSVKNLIIKIKTREKK